MIIRMSVGFFNRIGWWRRRGSQCKLTIKCKKGRKKTEKGKWIIRHSIVVGFFGNVIWGFHFILHSRSWRLESRERGHVVDEPYNYPLAILNCKLLFFLSKVFIFVRFCSRKRKRWIYEKWTVENNWGCVHTPFLFIFKRFSFNR